jgi:hypothetical protein
MFIDIQAPSGSPSHCRNYVSSLRYPTPLSTLIAGSLKTVTITAVTGQFTMSMPEPFPLCRNFGVFEINFKTHVPVDNAAGGELDDQVDNGGDKFVPL